MDLCGVSSNCSRYDRSWRVVCLWAAATLVLTAPPGAWCQQNVSFTFLPGDTGFSCTSYCDWEPCATNPGCGIRNSALQLIPFDGSSSNRYMAARYMRDAPVRLWNASFWTFFVLRVSPSSGGYTADGMTFLIAPNTSTPAGSVGGGFGFFNNSGDYTGAPSDGKDSRIVAVVFDTFKNPRDPPAPYVGLFVNNLVPSQSRTLAGGLPVDFFGNSFGVWVEYDAASELLEVSMVQVPALASRQAYGAAATTLRRNATSMFVSSINVTARVAEVSYLGFSAGTGLGVEINEVLYWQFETGASSALPALAPAPAPTPVPAGALAPDFRGVEDTGNAAQSSVTATIAVAIAASLVGVAVVSGALLFCWWRGHCGWCEAGRKNGNNGRYIFRLPMLDDAGPRVFSYEELRRATHDFLGSSLLGEGGFGKVFRGRLMDGTNVAVKRISEGSRQGEKEFLAEVTTIGRLRHKNLVPLLGWCHENTPKGELLLVYEYMPNGSLDQHVLPPEYETGLSQQQEVVMRRPVLSWDARYNILQGVASALLYLHEDWKEAVVHRDIKSSNVLLDANWNGRLGDFGLARTVERNRSAETASAVVGTRGYLAPEYPHTGKISVKADVYSFGVMVLEVVTGRRPVDWTRPPNQRVLVDWIRLLHQAARHGHGRLEDAADPALRGAFKTEQVVLLMQLAVLCTADEPSDRPSMRQVVQSLVLAGNSSILIPFPHSRFSDPSRSHTGSPSSNATSRSGGSQGLGRPGFSTGGTSSSSGH